MPIYEFVCTVCEDKTPMPYSMKMNESNVKVVECWVCGNEAERIPSCSTFELAGGGWAGSGYSKGA